MKLLKILSAVTEKRYRIWALVCSPKRLKLDSLTFVDYIVQIEDELHIKIQTNQMLKLYRTKLLAWRWQLKR